MLFLAVSESHLIHDLISWKLFRVVFLPQSEFCFVSLASCISSWRQGGRVGIHSQKQHYMILMTTDLEV